MRAQFLEAMLADLRAASGMLVDAGAAPARGAKLVSGPPTFTWLVWAIESMAERVPVLVASLESKDDASNDDLVATRVPVRARVSRRPGDYRQVGEQLIPWVWERRLRSSQGDTRPLAWLLHLLSRQQQHLQFQVYRLGKHLDDALRFRGDSSFYGAEEHAALLEIQARLNRAGAQLERAHQHVVLQAASNTIPNPTPPRLFPTSAEWTSLRIDAHALVDPRTAAPDFVSNLSRPERWMVADLPFLYQRWCGVKLVRAIDRAGWTPDPGFAEAILFGGSIGFHRGPSSIRLWVEPRILQRCLHESGLRCTVGMERTPDFVLLVPGCGGPEAFILDPTLQRHRDALVDKGRYLTELFLDPPRRIAGIPTLRRPVRSWACSPLPDRDSVLLREDGAVGAIPMNPESCNPEPLQAWVNDVAEHAQVWGWGSHPGAVAIGW